MRNNKQREERKGERNEYAREKKASDRQGRRERGEEALDDAPEDRDRLDARFLRARTTSGLPFSTRTRPKIDAPPKLHFHPHPSRKSSETLPSLKWNPLMGMTFLRWD